MGGFFLTVNTVRFDFASWAKFHELCLENEVWYVLGYNHVSNTFSISVLSEVPEKCFHRDGVASLNDFIDEYIKNMLEKLEIAKSQVYGH